MGGGEGGEEGEGEVFLLLGRSSGGVMTRPARMQRRQRLAMLLRVHLQPLGHRHHGRDVHEAEAEAGEETVAEEEADEALREAGCRAR